VSAQEITGDDEKAPREAQGAEVDEDKSVLSGCALRREEGNIFIIYYSSLYSIKALCSLLPTVPKNPLSAVQQSFLI
jgi:hypothetical protein